MLIYACMFYCLILISLAFSGHISKKQAFKGILPLIYGFIIAIPQIYVTLDLLKHINRIPWGYCRTTLNDLYTFILPNYLLIKLNIANKYFTQYFGQVFYSGSLFFISAFFCIIGNIALCIYNKKYTKQIISTNIYLWMGILALILSFGKEFYLWSILHSLPIFNKFIQPIKMMVFVNLFLNIAGAILLTRIVKNKRIIFSLFTITIILMIFHLKYSTSAFYNFKYNQYPNISSIIQNIPDIKEWRIYSYAPSRSNKSYFPLTLNLNFPSIYDIKSLNAYDDRLEILLNENMDLYKKMYNNDTSLVFQSNIIDAYLYDNFLEYGVKYFIYMNFKTNEEWYKLTKADEYAAYKIENFIKKNFTLYYKYKDINFYKFNNSKPLAFDENINSIPIKFNTQGAIIDLSQVKLPQKITINMLYRKYYNAYINNQECNIETDKYNRMVINVPQGIQKLVIKYHSPWEKGFLISIILFICLSIVLIFSRRYIDD